LIGKGHFVRNVWLPPHPDPWRWDKQVVPKHR